MAAVQMIRALKRRLEEEKEKENEKGKEDPKKKQRQGKAVVALVSSGSRILLTVHQGKIVFPFPIKMMADKRKKGENVLIKLMMEMEMMWLALLLKSWRKKQFYNKKNRRKKHDKKQMKGGMMALDHFVNSLL